MRGAPIGRRNRNIFRAPFAPLYTDWYMPQNPEKPQSADDEISAETVIEWLGRNPDFFEENFEEIGGLLPARFDGERNVADMQDFALRRMRSEIDRNRSREARLLKAAEENTLIQERIQGAVLAVLDADSLDSLISLITDELPELFGIEAAVLCLDGKAEIFEGDTRIVLRSDISEPTGLFDGLDTDIHSCACMRIDYAGGDQRGYLALGAADPQAFHPDQGTELLTFFADVLERGLSRWMTSANQ